MNQRPCPSQAELSALVHGTADIVDASTIADHVDACPVCAAVIRNLETSVDRVVAGLQASFVQDEFADESDYRKAVDVIAAIGRDPSFTSPTSPVAPAAGDSPPLGRIRDYQLLKELGAGGMGTVYKALHTQLEKIVAVKVLPRERTLDPQAVTRFKREMKAVGRLDHPQIVRALDAGLDGETHFLVMEFVDGFDLGTLVSRVGPLAIPDACEIIRQAALGLQHAYEHGLVHRDIKPSNLMLACGSAKPQATTETIDVECRDGSPTLRKGNSTSHPLRKGGEGGVGDNVDFGVRKSELQRGAEGTSSPAGNQDTRSAGTLAASPTVKILDLGLALLHDPQQPAGGELTGTSQIMGTVDYMAPEQIESSHAVDIRADLYSLGCTLWKLLTGHALFTGSQLDTPLKRMLAHVRQAPAPITERRPEVPPALEAVIHKLLAKNPSDRYAAPGEVAAALEPFTAGCNLAELAAFARDGIRRDSTVEPAHATTNVHLSSAFVDTDVPPPSQSQRPDPSSSLLKGVSGGVALSAAAPPRRRIRLAMSFASVAAFFLFGVWIIVRDKDGNIKGKLKLDEGDVVQLETDKQKASQRNVPTVGQNVHGTDRPATDSPGGPAFSNMALVPHPAAIKGIDAWTLETIGHRGRVQSISASSDGRHLATAGDDGSIRIWDPIAGRLIRILLGHSSRIYAVKWSPDGRWLASTTTLPEDGVRIWEAASGRLVNRLGVSAAALAWFQREGEVLLTTLGPETVVVWNADSAKAKRSVPLPLENLTMLEWSPDGTLLAFARTRPEAVGVWDDRASKVLWDKPAHRGRVQGLGWSPDGKTVATGGVDRGIRLWNAGTGESREIETQDQVQGLTWLKGGKTVLAGGSNGIYRVDGPGRDAKDRRIATAAGQTVTASPHGDWCAIADLDSIHILNATTGTVERDLPANGAAVTDVSIGPNGNVLAFAVTNSGANDTVRVRAFDLGQRIFPEPLIGRHGRGTFLQIAVSPDERKIATADAGQTVDLWDVATHGKVGSLKLEANLQSRLVWSPNNRFLAVIGADGVIRLWDTKTRREAARPPAIKMSATLTSSLTWSPDSRFLAATRLDGKSLAAWDTMNETLDSHFDVAGVGMTAQIAWSGNDDFLAAVDDARTLRFWETASGRQLLHDPIVLADQTHLLAWIPGTSTLATMDLQSHVRHWDARQGRMIREHAGVLSDEHWMLGGTLVASRLATATCFWDLSDGARYGTLFALSNAQTLAIGPQGHYVANRPAADTPPLIYVTSTSDGQNWYTPREFGKKFGWKNDPGRVELLGGKQSRQSDTSLRSPEDNQSGLGPANHGEEPK